MASGSAGGGGRATRGSGAERKTSAAASRRSKYKLNSYVGYGSIESITTSRRRGGMRRGSAEYWLPF